MSDGPLICDDCNSIIGTYRKDNRTLEIACQCDSRSIKTISVIPDQWA